MKYIIKIATLLLAGVFSLHAAADEPVAEQVTPTTQSNANWNHWTIGAGAQTLNVTNDVKDLEFSGHTIALSYAFKESMALRVSVHSLENDDMSSLESESYDMAMLFGTGLLEDGFKAYGGLGYFSDTWSLEGFSEDVDFSGLLLTAGIGYSWEYVSLDLLVGAREVADYEDFVEDAGFYGDVVAVTTSLTLSARF